MSKYKLVLDTAAPDDADSVAAAIRDAAGNLVTTTDAGGGVRAMDVNLASGSGFGIYNEDTAHTTADPGQAILAVRNDSESSLVSTDGDYANLQLDSVGRLRTLQRALAGDTDSVLISDGTNDLTINANGSIDVNLTDDGIPDGDADSGNPLKVGGRAIDGALTAVDSGDRVDNLTDLYRRQFVNNAPNIGMDTTAATVGTSAAELVASPLAGRTKILIQNRGNKPIFIGPTGVTVADGVEISSGGYFQEDWGEDVDVFAISSSAGQDVRIMEIA